MYWYSALAMRPAVSGMTGGLVGIARMPTFDPSLGRSSSINSLTFFLRSPRGLRTMNMRPWLLLPLGPPEPTEHMKHLTTSDARFFISTPCWNRQDCAANHVNEMLYEALGALFERHGFVVEHVYGTFASIRDYEYALDPHTSMLFSQLREYYDTNFLSCIFAPLFPAQSRNCLWELSKTNPQRFSGRFLMIDTIQRPWSSSVQWEDMAI